MILICLFKAIDLGHKLVIACVKWASSSAAHFETCNFRFESCMESFGEDFRSVLSNFPFSFVSEVLASRATVVCIPDKTDFFGNNNYVYM